MITVIIFDLGNVVLTNDWHYDCPEKFKEYSDYFGITYEDMEKGWDILWPQFKISKISENEFWKRFLETAGAKNIDIEHAKLLWRKYQKPIENMFNLLKELKQNYRLAALTTITKEWLDFKIEKFGLNNYFEVIVSSGHSGLAKPDKRIYKLILEKLKVNVKECVFIDDSEVCLTPAKELGFKTVLFEDSEQLKKELTLILNEKK